MSKFKIIIITILITIISIILLCVIVPYIIGYKINYSSKVEYDFQAMSAFGQWVSALMPVVLVFLSVYVTNKFDKTRRDIDQSNVATIDYVDQMIKQSKLYQDSSITTDSSEAIRSSLKEKAYKYVSIAGFTRTEKVANHLDVSEEQAYDILIELLKVDGKISAGGSTRKENMKNIVWTKKSKG